MGTRDRRVDAYIAKSPDFARLKENGKAATTFAAFSPSHERDYVEWITEAKTDATRERGPATAIAGMAEGRGRNWKYERRS